jgi:hypothetical protein
MISIIRGFRLSRYQGSGGIMRVAIPKSGNRFSGEMARQ